MPLATVTAALTQYNANLNWQESRSSATLALEALRYLYVNRAQRMGDEGSTLDYESIAAQISSLEGFLGAGASRAFGRSRRVAASFPDNPGVG